MQSKAMRFDDTVSEIIGTIGAPCFPAVAAAAVTRSLGFEFSTVVVHLPDQLPRLLTDQFDVAGGREGLENYLAATHRLNPMIEGLDERVFRARDFAIRPKEDAAWMLMVRDPAEELGFRTRGWPRGLEEVGVTFRGFGGMIEFCCYRSRGRRPDPLRALRVLHAPLAAAFRRHDELTAPPMVGTALTPREREVLDLMLIGCSSEAIALRLAIGRFTVKDHRKGIFRKLGVGSLSELFARCRHPL